VIFDEATLAKLTRLTLVASQVHSGRLKGERRSLKRGSSLEFADYRSYTPGDDLRRLDWKAYGRLDRPFLKLFEEEEDLQVHVLLDASTSMDWGDGEGNKFAYGQKLAAALGAIALSGGDCLYLQPLRIANKKDERLGPLRGKPGIPALLAFVETLSPGGTTELGASLAAVTRSGHRPGLAIVISDLFSPGDLWSGLSGLRARGDEVVLIQPLAPDEIEPALGGDLRLVDVETGAGQEVSIDGGIRRLYQRRLAEWRGEILAGCAQRGIRFMPLSTAQPWDVVVLQELRRMGVAR
jgi:uncharacterized protein (DUF58 family)